MKIAIVTGGTGGHIYPALALADMARKVDEKTEILFIGNDNRMEAQLIPQAGYRFQSLHTSGLTAGIVNKVKAVVQMVAASGKAKRYLKDFKPDIVIGFGGYVSAPVMFSAQSLGIPTMIHEQNSIVGKANKLVMNKVTSIVTCYEKCQEVFPKDKIQLLGNPRATIAKEAHLDQKYYDSLGLDLNKRLILIMMGSLGSSSVNELMKEALKDLDSSLQVLYVCGKDNSDDLNLFDGQDNIHVVDYVDTLKIYPKVEGLICRAGATTIAEITALGIPSILIPSPYVANNHQFYNASVLVDAQAAEMIEEKDLNSKTLQQKMNQVFLNAERYSVIRNNALKLGKPNAAYDIVALCKQIIG